MEDWQEILYWVTLFHFFGILLWEILGHYAFFRIPYLRQSNYDEPGQWPSVAIIFAAKDEQREIEQAVRSMLKVEYPNLKYIAVNDRSTDQTGNILDRLAEGDERLKVVHVQELPDGWLGKNNALQQAAVATDTDYLLLQMRMYPLTLNVLSEQLVTQNIMA